MSRAEDKRIAARMASYDKWCGSKCTLDGLPARIIAHNGYALICAINPQPAQHDQYQVSWEAVARIMSNHEGKFRS